jgi:hypothetical protein
VRGQKKSPPVTTTERAHTGENMQVDSLRESKSQSQKPPRVRAVLEFIEGDLSRPPIVYPASGGTYEEGEVIREEITKRWNQG